MKQETRSPLLSGRAGLKIVFFDALLCKVVDGAVRTGTDDDDEHVFVGANKFVDDAQAGIFELDFAAAGEICVL